MSALLPELTARLGEALAAGGLVFLRIGAAIFLMPAFGEQSVPLRIRLAGALAFTIIVAPAVAASLPDLPSTPLAVLPLLGAETVIGLAIGIGMRLFLIALQIAGTIAAQATSLSQFFGGVNADPQPAIAQFLLVAGLALAAVFDLHVKLAMLFVLSYDILPAGVMPAGADLSRWGIARVADGFSLAFSLAAPFVVAALIYNVAIGVINRAMPQLMVAFVGAPALTFGGLVLLLVSAPLALAVWLGRFGTFLHAPFAPVP